MTQTNDAHTVYVRYIVPKQQISNSEKSLVTSLLQLTLGTENSQRQPISRICCSNQLQFVVLDEVSQIWTESFVRASLDFSCYHLIFCPNPLKL